MNLRYYRASLAVYADICAQLDAAYGYPNEATKTHSTLPLPTQETTDSQGRVYLLLDSWDYERDLISELLSVSVVEQITAAQYHSQVPKLTP